MDDPTYIGGRIVLNLRDYFAAHALMGVLAAGAGDAPHRLATECYALADAMLVAREQVAGKDANGTD